LRRNSTTGRFRTGRKHTMQPRDSILLSAQVLIALKGTQMYRFGYIRDFSNV
jgi:hypothetical protein